MSVLTIRAHRRYALRMPVRLQGEGRTTAPCLLIELSQQGARLSNLGQAQFQPGDPVRLLTGCGKDLACTVRWAREGRAGLRLDQALHAFEMIELLDVNRREYAAA
ncbi:hypothetical protein GCM10011411_06550 [Aurantiacibacter arachoides]|nr:hypothetical protein GCM10011411_06550 [Aurantiacibacter arachoides]